MGKGRNRVTNKGQIMNLLYRAGSSRNNFQLSILESLRKDGVFDKCTILSQTLDDGDKYPKEYYHEMRATSFYFGRYDEFADISKLPSVPLYIWEGMRRYKDEALNMCMRPFNTHFYNYFEMDLIYSHSVRFWNYILDADDINMFFATVAPHSVWEYVIYGLCKVKNIPVLIVDETWMQGLGTVFTDLEHNGINVKKCYEKYDVIEPNEPLKKWYDHVLESRWAYTSAVRKANIKSNADFAKKMYYSTWYKDLYIMAIQYARRIVKGKEVNNDLTFYRELIKRRHAARKIKNKTKDIWWYDRKFGKEPVEGERFVLYLMQYMPEANLLPKSGVCSNQLIPARILAEGAAKAGVKLYVKEHFAQCPRPKSFYDELLSIPNLTLIKSDVPTGMLQDQAVAVASQTGQCLIESMVKDQPYFSMAYNLTSEGPGGYLIRSAEDVYDAIKEIENGLQISTEDTKRYFGAFYKTSVKVCLNYGEHETYSYEEVAKDIYTVIKEFVEAGMPDDFYFERKD